MLSEYAVKCLRTRVPLDAFHAVVNPKTVVFSASHATMSSDRKVRSLKISADPKFHHKNI